MTRASALLAFLLLMGISASAQAPAEPLSIASESVPKANVRHHYVVELKARGGTPPLNWQVVSGALPPGLTLDPAFGRIAGTARSVGDFRFAVKVTDAATPPQSAVGEFVLRVVAPLTVEWRIPPRVEGSNTIRGAVVVTNGTDDAFDLTFIAVAVNEIGKAFALGYQHFTLAPEHTSPILDFGSTLPAGNYVVHVDAIAEVASRNDIYRARLQTAAALPLTGLP